VGAGSPPDGIGDACQCGDVNNDGFVTGTDATLIKRASVDLSPYTGGIAAPYPAVVGPGQLDPFKCGVSTATCNGTAGTIIQQTSIRLAPGVQQTCTAAI